jgi:hypothetical protein
MDDSAAFTNAMYATVKCLEKFQELLVGKKVVVVLDNASCHSQTESRISACDDLAMLRLSPYPLCAFQSGVA